MQIKKDDFIRDGENIFSIACVLGNVVYVKRALGRNSAPVYEWDEVLKHYRKIEIMGK